MPATQRLLLEIYAYGTNTGIRAIAGNAVRGHSEDDIRYLRRSPARLPGDDRGRPGGSAPSSPPATCATGTYKARSTKASTSSSRGTALTA